MNDSANKNKRKKGLLACCLIAPALLVSLTLSVCVCVFLVNSCSRVIQDNKLKSEEAEIKAFIEAEIIKDGKANVPPAPDYMGKKQMDIYETIDASVWETIKGGKLVYRSIEHEKRNEGTGYARYGAGNSWSIAGSFETDNHQAEFYAEIEMDEHSSIACVVLNVQFENGGCWSSVSESLKAF